MESIRDKVAIVGMGCTHFGERWDMGVEDLLVEAAHEAFEDAGIHPSDIQAAWLGTVFSGVPAITMSPLGLQYIPMTRVENMCATGSEALRGAAYAVASGACDMALAIGVEKLKDSGQTGVKGPAIVGDNPDGSSAIGSGFSAPASFAYLGTRYFHHYHLAPEYGKELLAKIAVKNHDNGALNPKAHFHNKLSVQQVVRAPIVAWPLGLLDCCGVSDGAAAAIVVRADMAKHSGQIRSISKVWRSARAPGRESCARIMITSTWKRTFVHRKWPTIRQASPIPEKRSALPRSTIVLPPMS